MTEKVTITEIGPFKLTDIVLNLLPYKHVGLVSIYPTGHSVHTAFPTTLNEFAMNVFKFGYTSPVLPDYLKPKFTYGSTSRLSPDYIHFNNPFVIFSHYTHIKR
jgi:hypothetical protein